MATPRLKLKQQRSKDRRERIVGAATRLFGRKGVAQTSLTDIARLARVPLTSLYDYFKDKQALLAAVPEENYRALYEQLSDDSSNTASDPRAQLRAIFVANLAYIRANPDWGRVFFLEIWPSAAIGQARIRRAVDRYALRYVDLVGRAITAGAYDRKLDPYLAMSMLMGGMCQLTAVWLLYGEPYDLVQRGSELFDRLEMSFLDRTCQPEAAGPFMNSQSGRPASRRAARYRS